MYVGLYSTEGATEIKLFLESLWWMCPLQFSTRDTTLSRLVCSTIHEMDSHYLTFLWKEAFWASGKKGPRPKQTIYKHDSEIIGNFGILSVAQTLEYCLQLKHQLMKRQENFTQNIIFHPKLSLSSWIFEFQDCFSGRTKTLPYV